MTEAQQIPLAIRESVLTIFGVPLRCYVLDNGQRIVNADDMAELFRSMGDEDGPDVDREALQMELDAFGRWQRGVE